MDLVTVARIGKTHGVKGFVRINSLSGEYDHFFEMSEGVAVGKLGKQKRLEIETVKPFGDQVLIKFRGYDNPEDARTLSGSEFRVDRRHASPLREDEYYISDLIGCELVSDGKKLASVIGVAETGQADLLEVKTVEGAFRYVPLKDEYVGSVDTGARRIELKADWILE